MSDFIWANRMIPNNRRLVIIGLDGATFDLIQPWAAAGDLPNLQRLMAEGSWGPLESVVHPFTAQAWTSMVTGTQQGKHRVFDFWERDFNTYGFRLMNASHRALPALWNLLSQAGKDVIVVNVPQTYPPEPVQGVMVSGRDTPGLSAAYTFPPELKAELDTVSATPYVIVPDDWLWTQRGRPDLARTELLREADVRFDATLHLMDTRPWDMVFFVVGATDGAAHFFWKYHDPNHPLHDPAEAALYGDTLREVYRRCDQRIGQLLQRIEGMSTSMCWSCPTTARGRLDRRRSTEPLAGQPGPAAIPQRGTQPGHLGRAGGHVASHAAQRGKSWIYRQVGFQTLTKLRACGRTACARGWAPRRSSPAWTGSAPAPSAKSCAATSGSTWPAGIRRAWSSPARSTRRCATRLSPTLPALTDPATGARPIRRVWRREELFHGPYLERFPDLIVEADYSGRVQVPWRVPGAAQPASSRRGDGREHHHRLSSHERHLHRLGS